MVILAPWKPVVVIWLLLSGIILAGYIASSLMQGKPLFKPYTFHQERIHHGFAHRRPELGVTDSRAFNRSRCSNPKEVEGGGVAGPVETVFN